MGEGRGEGRGWVGGDVKGLDGESDDQSELIARRLRDRKAIWP